MSNKVTSSYNLRRRTQPRITQRFGDRLALDGFVWSSVATECIEILDSSSEEEQRQPGSPNESLTQQFGRIELFDSVEEEGDGNQQEQLFSYDEAEAAQSEGSTHTLSLFLTYQDKKRKKNTTRNSLLVVLLLHPPGTKGVQKTRMKKLFPLWNKVRHTRTLSLSSLRTIAFLEQ